MRCPYQMMMFPFWGKYATRAFIHGTRDDCYSQLEDSALFLWQLSREK